MQKFVYSLKNKNFFRLWLAQVVSQFGDRINQMALVGLIYSRVPGSALGLAKIMSFTILPVFLVGPVAGVYVDRWDRKTTLFVCDILRGLLVVTIPFIFMHQESLVPIYIVVFLIFCLSRFYIPAKLSIIPDLVEEKYLLAANSLVTISGMIAFVLGYACGGFLVEYVGPRDGFLWDAITFFASGLLVYSIQHRVDLHLERVNKEQLISKGKEVIALQKSVMQEIKEGLRYVIQHKEISFVINIMFVLFAAAGAIYVVLIVFVQETFQSVTQDFGLLSVFLGLGLATGSAVYGRLGEKVSKFLIIFLCLIFGGIMLTFFSLTVQTTQNFWIASTLSFILGFIVGPIFIASNTVIHEVSDSQMRGKVFSAMEIVMHLAFLITMFISSILSEYVARFWILVGVGVIFSLVGGVGLLRYQTKGIGSQKRS